MDEPAGQNLTREAKGQLILNAIRKNAGTHALRLHFMSVFPSAKWARNLDVPELPSFDVIAVLEYPANSERTKMDAEDAAITVVDSRRRLQDFDRLPRRTQSLQRSRFRVPPKHFLSGGVNSRLCDELKQVRHVSGNSPSRVWCIGARERASYCLLVFAGATSPTAAAASKIPISDRFRPSALARYRASSAVPSIIFESR